MIIIYHIYQKITLMEHCHGRGFRVYYAWRENGI